MRHPTQREHEALALSGHVPTVSSAVIVIATCVGAVGAFKAVELADNGTDAGIQLPAAAGARCIGITLAAGIIGAEVAVIVGGLGYVTCGATLTAPDALQADTDGDLIAAALNDVVVAELLEDGADTEKKLAMVYGLNGYIHA